MDNCHDFSYEMPSHCFKSSFARSVITDYNNQTRSLDSFHLNRPMVFEGVFKSGSYSLVSGVSSKSRMNEFRGTNQCTTTLHNHIKFPKEHSTQPNKVKQDKDIAMLWKLKQDATCAREPQAVGELQDLTGTESDVLRLHQECQRLLEENQCLQTMMSKRPSGMEQFIDATLLQSQVDTLVWQLKQAEARQHMYQEVMEQVVKFLERAYRKLDSPKSHIESSKLSLSPNGCSPGRLSPWTDSALHIPRTMQIHDPPNYSTFKDFTWRRPRKGPPHIVDTPTDKLSQEAFRLLRIAQSLLNTQEPDLTQRLCNSTCKPKPSLESHSNCVQDLPLSLPYPTSFSQKSSAAYTTSLNQPQEEDSAADHPASLQESSTSAANLNCTPDILHISSLSSNHLGKYKVTAQESSSSNSASPVGPNLAQYPSSCGAIKQQQLSEDESGFSSMSSFQEVGLPLVDLGCYEEEKSSSTLSLHSLTHPVEAVRSHPRQSNSFRLPRETLQVLWV